MRAGRGSATTICSPTCCSCSCAGPSRTRSPGCTRWRPGGSPGTGTRWRRSGTPRPRRTGGWPPGGSPTIGPGCTWAGRPPSAPRGWAERAAGWFAGHGSPVEAVGHAQAAQDWGLAARVLADNWPGLYLDGQAAVIHELLAGFPAEQLVADAELAAVAAGDELARGSLEAAGRYLALAGRVPV